MKPPGSKVISVTEQRLVSSHDDNGNVTGTAADARTSETPIHSPKHLMTNKLNDPGIVSAVQQMQDDDTNVLSAVYGTLQNYTTEMRSSLRYARQIQKALLPGEHSLKRVMDCFVYHSPKDIVSGDFFWFSVRFNRVILAVADCTGHGVPAALMSIIGNDILNTVVNEKNITEPAEILKHVNLRMHRSFENNIEGPDAIKDGMDLAVVSIDLNNKTIQFAGAQRPLLGFVNGQAIKIKGDLHSIGIHSPISAEFTQHSFRFGPTDMFYLGSDGFADQFGGPQNKRIGSRQFFKFLSALRLLNTDEQKQKMGSFFHQWKSINEQTDDVLVLGFRPGSLIY